MTHTSSYVVNAGWRILLQDLGIRPVDVLRRAELPEDLFTRAGTSLSTAAYFRLWQALEVETADPTLPIRIGRSISVEAFDPPIFAALCSANFNVAARRISRYKKLIAPMALHVDQGEKETTLELEWLDRSSDPPVSLVAAELVFFVQLARLATRVEIRPLKVATTRPPTPADAYTSYFGVEVHAESIHQLTFSAVDAARPFLTANDRMWRFFEPELQKRLSELDATATMTERVRASLLELLPSGNASVGAVSKKLGVSSRTLQRRLGSEGVSFQIVLNKTREELARHYLRSSAMSGAEISFLLGFEDPSSFFRAFHTWTGETPERVRTAMRARA